MTLLNPDGTPYRLTGRRNQYDLANPDLDLNDSFDQESLEAGGSPLFYYECMVQVQSIDHLYREDRGKLFAPYPIQLWCNYEPPQQSQPSSYDGMNPVGEEVIFELNRTATIQALGGHLPRYGSRLYTPHRQENWIVVDVKLAEFRMWGKFRIQVVASKFPENLTTMEGRVTAPVPTVRI